MLNPKDLARRHEAFGGAVAFYILPYLTFRTDLVVKEMEKIAPREEWTSAHHTLLQMEGNVVDIEFAEELPDEAKPLAYYWQEHNGDLKHNLHLMAQFANTELHNEFWDAWNRALDGVLARTTNRDAEADEGENPGEADADAP